MDMSPTQMIGLLVKLSVLSTVFALGLNATVDDSTYLWRRPLLLGRSFLAMYVVTPLVAILLVRVFAAPPPVEIAVLLMAISAGAPALPKKLLTLGGNPSYVYSLAVTMALLAIVTVPVSLALLGWFFGREATVAPGQVAWVLTTAFLAPLLAGMVVHRVAPMLAARVGEPLMKLASLVLLGVVVLILATSIPEIAAMRRQTFALLAVMTVAALAVGHVLGGPEPDNRTTLAVACATRFPGLGLLVASLNFPNARPLPIVVAFLLIAGVVVIPYARWRKTG